MNIIHFDKIDSTNVYCLKKFVELSDKTIVLADEQTCGKGRFNRVWVSNNCNNVYMSLVLKPNNTKYLANLTQYMSFVIAKIIQNYGVKPCIKWPNDVLINDKKISGVLCEGFLSKNKLQGCVLGVGVNLNMDRQMLDDIPKPATSLNIEILEDVNKQIFVEKLINKFFEKYEDVINKGFVSFKDEYIKYINFLGKTVYLQQKEDCPKEEYIAHSIDDNGNLVVLDNNYNKKIILSGDLIY